MVWRLGQCGIMSRQAALLTGLMQLIVMCIDQILKSNMESMKLPTGWAPQNSKAQNNVQVLGCVTNLLGGW